MFYSSTILLDYCIFPGYFGNMVFIFDFFFLIIAFYRISRMFSLGYLFFFFIGSVITVSLIFSPEILHFFFSAKKNFVLMRVFRYDILYWGFIFISWTLSYFSVGFNKSSPFYKEVLSQLKGNLSLPLKLTYVSLILFFFIPNHWYVNKMPTGGWSLYLICAIIWSIYFKDLYVVSFYVFHINLVWVSLVFGLLYHFSPNFKSRVSKLFTEELIFFLVGNPHSGSSKKVAEVFTWGGLGGVGLFMNSYVRDSSRICRDRAFNTVSQKQQIYPTSEANFDIKVEKQELVERSYDPLLSTLDTVSGYISGWWN